MAATSILFLSHWDYHNHALWLPGRSEVSVAWGLKFSRGPSFWNSLLFPPNTSEIYKLWGLRRKAKKRHICFFLNWCRFPDGIRNYYWLRRNTCLCLSLVLWSTDLANGSLWIPKRINKAFSVFADTHCPFLQLCQMQTPRANIPSFCSVQNLFRELHQWEPHIWFFVLMRLWT